METTPVLAIVGPTAVGKSTVADLVALASGGEVVSADSMQVYRGMDIGTAKTPPQRRLTTHHCIDLVEPGAPYSAALYQRDARAAIDAIHHRRALPVVAGGTGLYVRAALDEMEFPAGELSSPVRAALEARLAEAGPQALHEELRRLDPAAAAVIHPNNSRRVVRALEMHAEGTPYSSRAAAFGDRRFHYPNTMLIGLTMVREALYARIDARVAAMAAGGLLDEVHRLLEAGFRDALTAAQAIGYKELVPVVEGGCPLDDALAAIARATRRYAKRQLTWFRADPRIRWIDVTDLTSEQAAEAVRQLLESGHDG